MGDTSRSQTVSTKLQKIAEQARHYPEMLFTTLAHLIDVEFLHEAFRRTRKNASPGVDGVTAAEYAANLEQNLRDLICLPILFISTFFFFVVDRLFLMYH